MKVITADIAAFRQSVQPIYEAFRTANGDDLWNKLEAGRK